MASHTTYPRISISSIPPRDAKTPLVVPVGLNFGPTWVSITFFIDQDHYHTGVPGSDLYRSFFQDALSQKVQCNLDQRLSENLSTSDVSPFKSEEKAKELMQAFSKHIKSAVRMGAWALDFNPALHFKLMAVTVPDHWDECVRTHVATAAKLAGHPLDGSHMIIPLPRAIQSTFQMGKNTQGNYLTLILDYNKSYLHLMLVVNFDELMIIENFKKGTLHRDVCVMEDEVYFPLLGENELHKPPLVGSAVAAGADSLNNGSVNCQPSGGLPSVGDSTDNPSISKSAISDHFTCDPPPSIQSLSLSTDDFPTSDLPSGTLPTNDPLDSELHSSDQSAIDDSSSYKHTCGNPDDDPLPDDFYAHEPNCHNQTAHFKPIVDTVSEFMVQMITPWKSVLAGESSMPKYTADDVSTAVRNVKYIVIDGEASRAGMMDLGDAIENMFINEKWITIERIKSDCGAYGAALVAKRQLENPKHMDNWKDFPGYIPGRLPDVSGSD